MARKKRKVSIEKVAKPEVDTSLAIAIEQGTEFRKRIKDILAVADDQSALIGKETSLEKMWEEVCQFTDTNEMVRMNLQQIQIIFQEQFDKYYKRKAEHDLMLKEVLDKGEEYVNDYVEMQASFAKEQSEDIRMIMELSQRVEGMAKEYRQCALQKNGWCI